MKPGMINDDLVQWIILGEQKLEHEEVHNHDG